MRPKQKILEFIQQAHEAPEENAPTADDREAIREIFDGMSTGTARIVIEEEIKDQVAESHNISGLDNLGRYYVARILRPDGSVIRRLMVDKQTGHVQFVGR